MQILTQILSSSMKFAENLVFELMFVENEFIEVDVYFKVRH